MEKLKYRKKNLSRYFRCYVSVDGNNWVKLACQFVFAHNISVNSSSATAPYQIVFRFKPQIPISLKLGLVPDDNDLCRSEFCHSSGKHTYVKEETSHSCIDKKLSPRISMELLNCEIQLKNIYRKVYPKNREANHRSLSHKNKYKLAKTTTSLTKGSFGKS